MENAALPRRVAGPLERTVLELRRIDRDAVWRRPRVGRTRLLLRESDALIDLIERCRERGDRLLPTQLWSAVVRFVGALDADRCATSSASTATPATSPTCCSPARTCSWNARARSASP